MIASIRSEFLKLRTTKVWWCMLLGLVILVGIALAFNYFTADVQLHPAKYGGAQGGPPGQATPDVHNIAANIYTSGQYFGTLLSMLLGALLVTNEFFHKTATPTFLATPSRFTVIISKLITGAVWGAVFGVIATAIAVAVGALIIPTDGHQTYLHGNVLGSIGLNVVAFALWGVLGVGLGSLIRSQVATVVVCCVVKFIVDLGASFVLAILAQVTGEGWLNKVIYALPGQASTVLTSPVKMSGAPHWYTGGGILLGYALLAAGIGGLLMRRRDIS